MNLNIQSKTMKKIISVLLAFALAVTSYGSSAGGELYFDRYRPDTFEEAEKQSVVSAPDAAQPQAIENAERPDMLSELYMPGNMRGVRVSFSNDVRPVAATLSGNGSAKAIAAASNRMDAVLAKIIEIGFNTVIVDSTESEVSKRGIPGPVKTWYNTEQNSRDITDYLEILTNKAGALNMNVYVTFDISEILKTSRDRTEAMNGLAAALHGLVLKYHMDGVLLRGFEESKTLFTYGEYMRVGGGGGYDNWLRESREYFVRTAADTVRLTNPTVSVGLFAEPAALSALSSSSGDNGSVVNYADFVMLNMPHATVDGDSAGQTDIPNYGKPFYLYYSVDDANENVTSDILRQLSSRKTDGGYSGCAFATYGVLASNKGELSVLLSRYFENLLNEQSLFEDLVITQPREFEFATGESAQDFIGSFDDNFDLTFDGKKVVPGQAGNFFIRQPLKVGRNVFTLKHKGETFKYTIERKVTPLVSIAGDISYGRTITVEGGTSVQLSALAYAGSRVTAKLGGTVVSLSPQTAETDSTVYAAYRGIIVVPPAKDKAQNLGQIKITSALGASVRSMTGASIIVRERQNTFAQDIHAVLLDSDKSEAGEVVGTMPPLRTEEEDVKLVKVTRDNAQTYSGLTTGDSPSPKYASLPRGTLEYYRGESDDYYITESGRRVKTADSTLVSGKGIGENSLTVRAAGTDGRRSYIAVALDKRIGFSVSADVSGNVVKSFNAKTVSVVFDNVTSVRKLPSFDDCEVFSGGRWDTVTENGISKFRLTLTLRKAGVYAGYSSYYLGDKPDVPPSDGEILVLSFPVTRPSLAGMSIVIDPGHGYGKAADRFDPGAVGEIIEETAVLAVSKKLEAELVRRGATVHRLRTESEFFLTEQRPLFARDYYNPDLFISLHANMQPPNPPPPIVTESETAEPAEPEPTAGSEIAQTENNDNSETATTAETETEPETEPEPTPVYSYVPFGSVRGQEAYYFTPYSQPLAKAVSASLGKYFSESVYADHANENKGAIYNIFWVTRVPDFPSILLELGYVSNKEDADALADDSKQSGIAAAIADGIEDYLRGGGEVEKSQ